MTVCCYECGNNHENEGGDCPFCSNISDRDDGQFKDLYQPISMSIYDDKIIGMSLCCDLIDNDAKKVIFKKGFYISRDSLEELKKHKIKEVLVQLEPPF